MQFKAQYKATGKPDYWRTIDADTINEALKIADKYRRKDYALVSCTQQLGKD